MATSSLVALGSRLKAQGGLGVESAEEPRSEPAGLKAFGELAKDSGRLKAGMLQARVVALVTKYFILEVVCPFMSCIKAAASALVC